MTPRFAVVVPTVGRPSLHRLLAALDASDGPRPDAVIVVDDRSGAEQPSKQPPNPRRVCGFVRDAPARANETAHSRLSTPTLPVTVLRSGGRGPAAARNVGWRSTRAEWVCFLDDDVVPQPDWLAAVAEDLAKAEVEAAAGSQGMIEVPRVGGRRATDDERRTQRLADAQWITADMAFRRDVLVDVGGFDERFPRAYREDADIALGITQMGNTIVRGNRRCTHPVASATLMSSVRAQIGNRDNALMRRKHGRRWRAAIGEGRGRLAVHALTVATVGAAALGALTGRPRIVGSAGALWATLTAQFAARRFWAGPHTATEAARMLVTSVLIPPVAVGHRLAGAWAFRAARRDPPLAVLFDRDDTLIEDGPYLSDPAGVRPLAGVRDALNRLRRNGLLLAVVTNQSGVAKGLISPAQLDAVNEEVNVALGPFDSWQVCRHDADDGCGCRKPAPGMVYAVAAALGVDPTRCVLIGDTGGDVSAALAAGADAILVPTGRTLRQEVSDAPRVAATLSDAVSLVLKECR